MATVGSGMEADLPPRRAMITPVAFSRTGIQRPSWSVDAESLTASSASVGGVTVAESPLGKVTWNRPSGSTVMAFVITSGR
jgi:hypothetical protein